MNLAGLKSRLQHSSSSSSFYNIDNITIEEFKRIHSTSEYEAHLIVWELFRRGSWRIVRFNSQREFDEKALFALDEGFLGIVFRNTLFCTYCLSPVSESLSVEEQFVYKPGIRDVKRMLKYEEEVRKHEARVRGRAPRDIDVRDFLSISIEPQVREILKRRLFDCGVKPFQGFDERLGVLAREVSRRLLSKVSLINGNLTDYLSNLENPRNIDMGFVFDENVRNIIMSIMVMSMIENEVQIKEFTRVRKCISKWIKDLGGRTHVGSGVGEFIPPELISKHEMYIRENRELLLALRSAYPNLIESYFKRS